MDIDKTNSDWSEQEIQAAVDAYLDMLQREKKGLKINKAHENRVLREGPLSGRTKGSVEFRMQNISTVLMELNQERIIGYKPAKNVGANVVRSIREALDAYNHMASPEDFEPTADEAVLEQRALKLEKHPLKTPPRGIENPQQSPSTGKAYIRDPEVRAWVRQQAKGVCEGCGQPAPFQINETPFLEVHHVKHLAHQGSDRPSNAVALCPNCHRRCHHSSDKQAFTDALYDRVKRLVREP
ncbi:HNH endonuclease [Pseudomonas sp. NPDC088368]|jgi:5-methylcytosine-specific restriction protein A|uniref:HNH endonuclease n=1 Tax=Pseudomonas sp. NPDC088368 TaxID=3364453 RepID=UPI0038280385